MQLPVDEKRIQVVNVYQDEIRLVVPAGHRLASRAGVSAQDLTEDYLILPQQGRTRTRLNAWLEPVEEEIRISMELDSTELMKRFVMAGMGLTFLAVSNFQEEIAAGKLQDVPLLPEPLVRRLGLIYRKDKALSKAALGFIQVVLDLLGERVQGSGKGDRVVA
jgi:DNA-binding transcriptional LysR family regulator